MTTMRSITGLLMIATATLIGCQSAAEPTWGTEKQQSLPGTKRQVWAVAPAINLSGQREVDPLLQADLAYQQLQQVDGVTVIPVNRVAEVYASLRIEKVQSREQAAIVCDLLGADALLVPTVTAYDPYNPPKLGASLHLFGKPAGYDRPMNVDPRELSRQARPKPTESAPPPAAGFLQVVGMFDAANGSVRDALFRYAEGRSDPVGAYGKNEYLVDMDRYGGFVYHELIAELLRHPRLVKPTRG